MSDPGDFDTRDAARCRETIADLPVTNVAAAHDILHRLLKAMYEAPPAPLDYLSVLEAAREPLAFLQEAISSRYAAKPLPSSAMETNAFEQVLAFWRLMAQSYARAAQQGGGETEFRKHLAHVCQRCIDYAGQMVIEHYRARRPVAGGVWLDLHGYYDTAEEWGITTEPVADPLREHETSCESAYAAVLLVDLANPYSRSPKELSWILRWAQTMAAHTELKRPDDDGQQGYGVDLMQDRGLLPVERLADRPSVRVFDTSRLGEQVQQLLARLKTGESPADLGLGQDCPSLLAGRLLLQLYRPWCLAAMPRRFERSEATGTLAVVYEADSIYFHVCGREFVQPEHARRRGFSNTDIQRLWMYRHQLDPTTPLALRTAQLGYAHDPWEIADHSLNGYRLARNAAGPRVEHNQLIAIQAPGKDGFQLARISWLYQEPDGRLHAGIHVLPGPVVGIAIRPTGVAVTAAGQYIPAYFLPAVPALKEGLSVVLPPGWFNPGRTIEIFTDRPVNARLVELLARGPNFERCSFALAEATRPAAPATPR